MRILPDNPSVDFLKREAKDLLAALRESAPETTLSEAQRLLAEQYGYRTWPDLKADVERRRASTPAADPALAAALAAGFGVGRVTSALAPISYGHMGRTWSLQTDRGRFLAWPVFPWVAGAQAEFADQLRERSREAGITAPAAVRASDGELVKQIGDEHWLLLEWMDFGPVPMPPVRSAVARRAGEMIATIHGLSLPTERPVTPYLTYKRTDDEWQQLVDRARAAQKPWLDDLVRLLPTVAELRAATTDTPPSPLILTHCDLNPESVRTGANGELIVVHWDFAGSLPVEWELGAMLMQWAFRPTVNERAVRAFVEGYTATAGTFPALDVSSFSVAICGWLNWAHSHFCAAIDPTSPDEADVAEREARELLAQPLTVASITDALSTLEPATR